MSGSVPVRVLALLARLHCAEGTRESEFGNEGLMQIYDAASVVPRDDA